MILNDYAYCKPASKQDAFAIIDEHGSNCKFLAGGSDLIPLLRNGNVSPKVIIDLKGIGLNQVNIIEDGDLEVGAFTTLANLENQDNDIIKNNYVALFEAVSEMATPQVRNRATIGGNICHAAPSADTAPPLLVYEAKALIENNNKERIIPLEEFFIGPGTTCLQKKEILTAIILPKLAYRSGAAYLKHRRLYKDLALVGVAVLIELAEDNTCNKVRIAAGAVAPVPFRIKRAEQLLESKKLTDDDIKLAADIAAEEVKPINDVRASASYRKSITRELTINALQKAYERSMKGE